MNLSPWLLLWKTSSGITIRNNKSAMLDFTVLLLRNTPPTPLTPYPHAYRLGITARNLWETTTSTPSIVEPSVLSSAVAHNHHPLQYVLTPLSRSADCLACSLSLCFTQFFSSFLSRKINTIDDGEKTEIMGKFSCQKMSVWKGRSAFHYLYMPCHQVSN